MRFWSHIQWLLESKRFRIVFQPKLLSEGSDKQPEQQFLSTPVVSTEQSSQVVKKCDVLLLRPLFERLFVLRTWQVMLKSTESLLTVDLSRYHDEHRPIITSFSFSWNKIMMN